MAQTSPQDLKTKILRNTLGVLLLIFMAIGLITVGVFAYRLFASFNYGFLTKPWATISKGFGDHPDAWVTAIATGFIGWATWMLRRSTESLVAANSPIISYRLTREDTAMPAPPIPYYQPWVTEDETHPLLAPILAGKPPVYVRITMANEQTATSGVAIDVKITVTLKWGAIDNVTPHPHSISRDATATAIGAGRSAEGRVFNVAGLPNYVINVDNVKYQNVRAKRHRTSYGRGNLWQKLNDVPLETSETVFTPLKGEVPR